MSRANDAAEVELERLRRLVEASADAMRGASPRAMRDEPGCGFLDQYDRIRAEALRLLPRLAGLIPPQASRGSEDEDHARFLEVRVYLAQLGVLLTPAPEVRRRTEGGGA